MHGTLLHIFPAGGIAAYNFGAKNVLNPDHRLDIGTHNHDYSNDVVARAQHLITKYEWYILSEYY